jgi:hypothetical protein
MGGPSKSQDCQINRVETEALARSFLFLKSPSKNGNLSDIWQPLALHYDYDKNLNNGKRSTAAFALLITIRTLFLPEVA